MFSLILKGLENHMGLSSYQLRYSVFRMVHGNGVTESEIEEETFNKYIQPGKDAIWDERTCSIYGLSKDDDRIVKADEIDVV